MRSTYEISCIQPLEVQAHPRHKGPLARQLVVIVERIQFVVLVVDIQKPERDVAEVSPKSVSRIGIELKNFITGNIRRIANITLSGPVTLQATEEPRRMIIDRENLCLM